MSAPTADVIIIGAGPSGVAAALELRRRGVARVLLLERETYLGGATRHCSHSPFGMREFGRVYFGAAYARRLEREVAQAGIELRTGHTVVRLLGGARVLVSSRRGVEELSARRILTTTGAREQPRSARLMSGDRPLGVVTTGTLQSYVAFHGLMPFRKPLIVGSELVSLSAVLTCVSHGAKPVAMVESRDHALARAPLNWFPHMAGVPFHLDTDIVDIRGQSRVEAVSLRRHGQEQWLACDGVLLTGQFTPESALFLQSPMGLDARSAGPAIDQYGRTADAAIFAAGNVLRAVETGGWSFREGRAVGAAIAADLKDESARAAPVPIHIDAPIKLVVPSVLRRSQQAPAFEHFQLRFQCRARGCLSLEIDGSQVWQHSAQWLPERRVLVPIPAHASQAQFLRFRFRENI